MKINMTDHAAGAADADIAAVKHLLAKENLQPLSGEPGVFAPAGQSGPTGNPSPQGGAPRERQVSLGTLVVATFALWVILYPWIALVAVALALLPFVGLFAYLAMVGIDGFWRNTRALYLRVKSGNPRLARRLRRGFYMGAARWGQLVDHMPWAMPDAAYAPDFQAIAEADAAHEAALKERFARLADEMSA